MNTRPSSKTVAYKITGILAALSLATALSASAQDTAQTPAAQQATPPAPATAPQDPATAPAGPVASDVAAAPAASDAPKQFIQQAYLANEFGIAAGQLALQQSKSAGTRAAAQAVLNDGMKVRQDMITAIQGSTSDMHFDQNWTEEYKQKLADLQSATGGDFDKTYLSTQGQVTQTATSLFSDYAQTGTDASIKSFAATNLPKLQADASKLEAATTASATVKTTKTSKTKTTSGT